MNPPNYRRTVVLVEVLSDGPLEFDTLEELHHLITVGDCSGQWTVTKDEAVSKRRMTRLLQAQGSDPSFLIRDEAE